MVFKELLAVIADPTSITIFIEGSKEIEKRAFELDEFLDSKVELVIPTGHLSAFVHLVK